MVLRPSLRIDDRIDASSTMLYKHQRTVHSPHHKYALWWILVPSFICLWHNCCSSSVVRSTWSVFSTLSTLCRWAHRVPHNSSHNPRNPGEMPRIMGQPRGRVSADPQHHNRRPMRLLSTDYRWGSIYRLRTANGAAVMLLTQATYSKHLKRDCDD